MMRFDSFGRTVLFGAIAAAGWIPWMLLVAPLMGTTTARAAYLIAVTAMYLAGLSATAPYRLMLVVATLVGAGLFAVVADTTSSLVVVLTVILGVGRSGFLSVAPAPQAVIREAMLLFGGLWLARFVGGATAIPTSGALWAFFLVQGLFFLMPRHREGNGRAQVDPFDAAYRRALSLLEERA